MAGVVIGVTIGFTGPTGTRLLPNCANGFGLPVVASGTSTIVESCKLENAGSEKIESFNFILWVFNSNVKKSSVAKDVSLETALVPVFVFGSVEVEETKLA